MGGVETSDWYGRPIELVQHFANRGSSHLLKGAVRHILGMVWLYRCLSRWGVGRYYTRLNYFYLPSRRLEEGKGVSTLWWKPIH